MKLAKLPGWRGTLRGAPPGFGTYRHRVGWSQQIYGGRKPPFLFMTFRFAIFLAALVSSTEKPFRGETSVSPESFRIMYDSLMNNGESSGPAAPPADKKWTGPPRPTHPHPGDILHGEV